MSRRRDWWTIYDTDEMDYAIERDLEYERNVMDEELNTNLERMKKEFMRKNKDHFESESDLFEV